MDSIMQSFGYHEKPLEKTDICEIHGEYANICYLRSIWVGCPACNQIKKEESEVQAAKKEAYEKNKRWIYKIGHAGISERFFTRTLDSYVVDSENSKQVKIFEFCKDYALNFTERKKQGLSFLMLGTVGTGKTHLSVGIALQVMEKGHSAIFTSASKMLRSIKDTYRKESDKSESQVMAIYETSDLLILDEVGIQRGSTYEKDIIFDVINARYEALLPTIVLSNLTIDECKLYLGERVFDRLRENGGRAFLLDWPSHRK